MWFRRAGAVSIAVSALTLGVGTPAAVADPPPTCVWMDYFTTDFAFFADHASDIFVGTVTAQLDSGREKYGSPITRFQVQVDRTFTGTLTGSTGITQYGDPTCMVNEDPLLVVGEQVLFQVRVDPETGAAPIVAPTYGDHRLSEVEKAALAANDPVLPETLGQLQQYLAQQPQG